MTDDTKESDIVHCNKCNKMIANSLSQNFKSEDEILKGFLLCIPCTLRLKESLKFSALQVNKKGILDTYGFKDPVQELKLNKNFYPESENV